MGAAAMEILLEQIKDPGRAPQKKVIKSNLILRASTQLVAHAVPLLSKVRH
jgi:DNA-binding LacI/PurR family transcriptional regulator